MEISNISGIKHKRSLEELFIEITKKFKARLVL